MKKLIVMSMLALVSGSALAAFTGPDTAAISTVKDAQNAADDSYVLLTGNIVQALGDETYLFKDETGQIEVEIDNEDWRGQDVSPQDKVAIRGEVDSEWTTTQIDVDTIQKL
ncbi:NirD/YgiW/YdeI family stress tolerance protein [Vibrio alfacsensis]|uniref:NirD/YgiW/YdeI family stress tolerance protein n=1 Tax=Vibrio alfacsensis TaxID=1074311 RepID=A0ABN5PI95_9VIBR|nr:MULTISPECIES: NirD/YgiW/YdeI family stress tolerance protein [Vibrio]AXY02892.1 NirD/YgiW/YdeI family stress tolerance protein [Vibrio alfacsensis]CAE6927323.1 Protein YgiW [Vibrio sp. B1REV9]